MNFKTPAPSVSGIKISKKMKKLFFIASLLITNTSFSQTSKGLQKITFGTVVAVSANTVITTPVKPLTMGYNLLPNLCFVTPKTYHNFLYGIGNKSLKAINGYKPKSDLGVYLALSKSLTSSSSYAGIGVEKFLKASDNITFFLFSEIGTNIGPLSQAKIFTLGTHINIQSPIWKRKS